MSAAVRYFSGLRVRVRVRGTFTRCMDAALSPMRQRGIRILNYLDNWLVCAVSEEQCRHHVALLLEHVQRLGLHLNYSRNAPAFPGDNLPGNGSGLKEGNDYIDPGEAAVFQSFSCGRTLGSTGYSVFASWA